ncbi:uncharacterized protein F4812DRAFT_251536 [Daldinia caldariorum]|uniref:uncharacterized protein n=1 Tax=Daldinia caldariorum TaxID=326644 RepID=UPI0020084274|nr:uncharacterized protein F4812DRAFT_251536 [Daldinia caldariorum]KAI1463326.1 hypothetical protein F4812DRAFT_251536 [Daldinia caldariorum]
MSTFSNLIARGNAILSRRDLEMGDEPDKVIDLMIGFLGVAFLALVLVVLLIMMRRAKRERQLQDETLPQYNDIKHDDGTTRRFTIQTADGRSSILVVNGRPMLNDPSSPPYSPNNIPEIHITFPDEQDEQGHNKGGRVVVVRVGETTVGLEPVKEEQLPAYEKESSTSFHSIDMDQIGGLKEKDRSQFS